MIPDTSTVALSGTQPETVWQFLSGIGTVVGAFVSWIFTNKRNEANVRKFNAEVLKLTQEVEKFKSEAKKFESESIKLESENVKFKTDQLKAKNEIENNLKDANTRASKLVTGLIDLLLISETEPDYEKVFASLNSNREALLDVIANEVLHHFCQLIEMESLIVSNKTKYFEGYILPELERFGQWIEILNNPTLLKYTGSLDLDLYSDRPSKEPYYISSHWFMKVEDILEKSVGVTLIAESRLDTIKQRMCGKLTQNR